MSSQVDATVPADNVKPDKALVRQNFQVIKNEISALQVLNTVARKMAFDDLSFDNL
ncbi:hypothetical protein UFOVP1323_19 [uncultured Caudovirales phage]|uniref:Uncharacterized protein n=1 Tax=uncultured Caudovirales phage TaxID=2100421 RepID=A0A6J5RUS3_9CAUD|nr:hypothetical protein UFOVP1323_19 [uncultured Caudovirales phage]